MISAVLVLTNANGRGQVWVGGEQCGESATSGARGQAKPLADGLAGDGIDGGNDGGKGITDTPGGIKLQAEGHPVLYRNIWIKELDLEQPDTDF